MSPDSCSHKEHEYCYTRDIREENMGNMLIFLCLFSFFYFFSFSSGRLRKSRRRRFRTLHNTVDTGTLMIHATGVRTRSGGNSRFMVPPVRRVSKDNLATVYCDKAYISRRNVQFIAFFHSSRVNAFWRREYGEVHEDALERANSIIKRMKWWPVKDS